MEICPVGGELFQVDGPTNRHMTKVICHKVSNDRTTGDHKLAAKYRMTWRLEIISWPQSIGW